MIQTTSRRRNQPRASVDGHPHRRQAELAPLLAEEGIDVDSLDELNAPDLASLQAALNRAVERHSLNATQLKGSSQMRVQRSPRVGALMWVEAFRG